MGQIERYKRRGIGRFLGTLLALGLLAPLLLQVRAGTAAAASYTYPCSGPPSHTFQQFMLVDFTGTSHYVTEQEGYVWARPLSACGQNGSYFDAPQVLGATIQLSDAGGADLIQVGYESCGWAGGCSTPSGIIPDDGNVYPIWTQDDEGGAVYLATFYHGGQALHLNDDYAFLLNLQSDGNWAVCIRDYTRNEQWTSSTCTDWYNDWGAGQYVTWPVEDHDPESVNGVTSVATQLNENNMLYKVDGIWGRIENYTQCWDYTDYGSWPSYYNCFIDRTYKANDTFNAYTDPH